jgi:hypothetical protein
MEFESRKSLLYMLFSSSAFVTSVYLAGGYAAITSPGIIIMGALPVLAYLGSRFTGGGDGEIVYGSTVIGRAITRFMGLMPLCAALLLGPPEYLGLYDEPVSRPDQIIQFVFALSGAPVGLLVARPYGIKIEDVARELVSSIRS